MCACSVIVGASAGVHLSGSSRTTVSGNRIDAVLGVWLDSAFWSNKAHTEFTPFTPTGNTITGNTISCSFCGVGATAGALLDTADGRGGVAFNASSSTGLRFSGAVGNSAVGNTIDGGNNSASVGVEFRDSANVPPGAPPVRAVSNVVSGNTMLGVREGVLPGGQDNLVSGNLLVP